MVKECKKEDYYWEYFNKTKSRKLNRITEKKCFKSKSKAVTHGIKKWEQGKWIQGDLVHIKNVFNHREVADLTTKGVVVGKYYKDKKKYPVLRRAKFYDKTSVF